MSTPITKNDIDKSLDWIHRFHAAGDALEPHYWVNTFWHSDTVLKFGNYPPIVGRENIIKMFETQFQVLETMHHEVVDVDVLPNKIYQSAFITYTVKNDPEQQKIKIPGMAVFHKKINEDHMTAFDVYIDSSPLQERIKMFNK